MNRALQIAIIVLVVVGGVGFLAYQSIGSVTPYKHVDEVVAQQGKYLKLRQIQVHGYARNVPIEGTIQGQVIAREFELEWKGKRIHVRHEGVAPDTFKEQGETVATGKLSEVNGKLVLNTVGGEKGLNAKCPSKYQEGK